MNWTLVRLTVVGSAMSKNVALSILALAAALLIGVVLTACSTDNKLSEPEACQRATVYLKKDAEAHNEYVLRQNMGPLNQVRILDIMGCKNFSSITERGWAEIELSYLYQTQGLFKNGTHKYDFLRTDQGWKLNTENSIAHSARVFGSSSIPETPVGKACESNSQCSGNQYCLGTAGSKTCQEGG